MTDHSDWEFFQDEGYFGTWCVRENGVRRFGEGFHTVSKEEAEALAYALSSQSLSLSEAREEIERLKGLVAASEAQRYRVCGELLARVEAAEQALKPFALTAEHDIGSTETDADIFQQMGQYNRAPKITVGDMRRALAALENGPAGLADATNDPADPSLSSLRKGAEELDAALLESTAMRHSTGEYYSVEVFFMSLDSSERFRALLSARCARIRSALVSGSREEQS